MPIYDIAALLPRSKQGWMRKKDLAAWRTEDPISPRALPEVSSLMHIYTTQQSHAQPDRENSHCVSRDTQHTVKRPQYPDGESAVAVGPWSHTLTQPRIRPTVSQHCGPERKQYSRRRGSR